ncbi:MAG: GNAT family N-acetyltransferase [Asgard group archaeon]|nr:GNAT family N-acetyltransferase [Asgard group archaeon]
MLIQVENKKYAQFLPLFQEHEHLRIVLKTILKEKMGNLLVDDMENPKLGLLLYKVFAFIAGDPSHPYAKEVLKYLYENRMVLFPTKKWKIFAEKYLVLNPYPRTKYSSKNLSVEKMEKFLEIELPEDFTLEKIDLQTVYNFNPSLAPAFFPFFKNREDFIERGLGYCVKHNKKVISAAAASMPIYDDEFEIQVITENKKEYRQHGFATIACAALIKESLEKGLEPHWDADNEVSAKFALKLGFSNPEPYIAYLCVKNKLHG